MMNQHSIQRKHFTVLLGLCLGLVLHAHAQQRAGGAGGGFGGAARTATSGSGTSTARQYPNNTTIGDAYFSIDPETRRVVFIADEATAKSLSQVLTNLDRPKPQVLIKVVFLEVTHDDASDIGVEGTFGKSFGGSGGTNTTVLGTNLFGLPGSSSTFGGANGIYQVVGQDYTVTLHAIAQASKAKVLSRPSILARNNQQASAFGFTGTPSFIVGKFRVPGVLTMEQFGMAIADARKAAKKK